MRNNILIKSIPSIPNFIIMTIAMIILLFATGVMSFEYYDDFRNGKLEWTDLFNIVFWGFGVFGFFYILIFGNRQILIETDRIVFKSIINQKFDSEYKFNNLDYYFIGYEYARFDEYETLYLVKDKKVIERISSFNYRNLSDLEGKLNLEKRERVTLNFIQKGLIIFRKEIKID